MFHQLLKIKLIKEQKAIEELHVARKKFNNIELQLTDSRDELQEYIIWRKNKEKLLYADVFYTEVKQYELQALKDKVAYIRLQDVELEKKISELEKKLSEAEKKLENAQEKKDFASKAVQKLEELVAHFDEEERKNQIKKEESEIEDITFKQNHL